MNSSILQLLMKKRLLLNYFLNLFNILPPHKCCLPNTNTELVNTSQREVESNLQSSIAKAIKTQFGKSGSHEKITYVRQTREGSEKLTWDSIKQLPVHCEDRFFGFESRQVSRSSGYQSNNGNVFSRTGAFSTMHDYNSDQQLFDCHFVPTIPLHHSSHPTHTSSPGKDDQSISADYSKIHPASNWPSGYTDSSRSVNDMEQPHTSNTNSNYQTSIFQSQTDSAFGHEKDDVHDQLPTPNYRNNARHGIHVTKSSSCEAGKNTSSNAYHHHLAKR